MESDRFHSVISAIIENEPPRIDDAPDAIWEVIAKALAKELLPPPRVRIFATDDDLLGLIKLGPGR